MRKWPLKSGKSIDLNVTVLVKLISDWSAVLKKLSPFAGTFFLLFNIPVLLKNRKALLTILFLIPLLIIHPSMEVIRFIFSVSILWIFLDKLSSGLGNLNPYIGIFISVYSIVIFAGMGNTDLYHRMYDGSIRYKFLLETYNALSIVVFFFFIYLSETLLQVYSLPGFRWTRLILIIAICALTIVFLFIKSRLYIGMSFSYLIIISLLRYKQIRILPLIPILYGLVFLGLTKFTMIKLAEDKKTGPAIAGSSPANRPINDTNQQSSLPVQTSGETANSRPESKFVAIMENDRLLKSSTTGRGKLTSAVLETYDSLGWKRMIYGYSLDKYLLIKEKIPFIDVKASTFTENSYFTTTLVSGFAGLLLLFYLIGRYIWYFLRRRQYYSLAFLALLLSVWYFEETVMFTFSLIGHLLALASINSLEKKDHESSPHN